MATRTITIHDTCTIPECGRTLHTIAEGERGTCSSCWFKSLKPDTKKSMNKLIASAFNGSTDAEKDEAVTDALAKLKTETGG